MKLRIVGTLAVSLSIAVPAEAEAQTCPDEDLSADTHTPQEVVACYNALKADYNTVSGNLAAAIERLNELEAGLDDRISNAVTQLVNANNTVLWTDWFDPLSGAVLAFPSGENRETECPLGWEVFRPATGRMIVGAGDKFHKDYRDWRVHEGENKFREYSLPDYDLMETGGAPEHTLKRAEMPEHNHGGKTGQPTIQGGDAGAYAIWYDAGNESEFSADKGSGLGFHNKARHTHTIGVDGASEAHPTMPPFIALYFCMKS